MNLKFKVFVASTLIFAAYANADHTANTGAIFTRDRSNPRLGEAYRDPSGLIWGEVITPSMNQRDAENACKNIGARLPTRDEFLSLWTYLGGGSEKGYSPYIMANESSTEVLPLLSSYRFWSSSVDSVYSDTAFFFHGYYGYVHTAYRGDDYVVRCVSGR